jgi:23S rRNA (guanosine2251-2'-O)-methyltransferase
MSEKLSITNFHSIYECIRQNPEKILKIIFQKRNLTPREQALKEEALLKKIKIEIQLNEKNSKAQDGVTAILKEFQYYNFKKFCEDLEEACKQSLNPVVLVLDGVVDPHNLGAIIRTAAFMGIDGVILPKDRAAQVTSTVYNIASGGLEYLKIVQVTNIAIALDELKQHGMWVVGFSEHAKQSLSEIKRDFASVLVIGNEEKGMRPLVQQKCDYLVKLDTKGHLQSLNASVAAALAMAWARKIF